MGCWWTLLGWLANTLGELSCQGISRFHLTFCLHKHLILNRAGMIYIAWKNGVCQWQSCNMVYVGDDKQMTFFKELTIKAFSYPYEWCIQYIGFINSLFSVMFVGVSTLPTACLPSMLHLFSPCSHLIILMEEYWLVWEILFMKSW